MASFLFATYPSPGHVGPASAVIKALTCRGHEVRWYTGQRFEKVASEVGARFCGMPEALDWDYNQLNAAFPGRAELKGIKQVQFDMVEIFVRPLREHLLALKALLEEEPADAFVSHFVFYGGGWLHEMGGPPNATLGDTCLAYPSSDVAPFGMGLAPRSGFVGHVRNRALDAIGRATVLAPAFKAAQEVRSGLGLSSISRRNLQFGFFFSEFLHLQLCPAGFEYPRSDLPPFVHFVGAPEPQVPPDFDPPSWWPKLLESRPVVLVTQGTIATDPADLLAPSLDGLAGRDMFIVVTTGEADPAALRGVGTNAVVERFVPYAALMPHVDVVVSNGGFGAVQSAIAHGVPLVVAGNTEDKKEITTRVAWSGVGINLRTNRPSPKAVADAVDRVLNQPTFRDRARALKAQVGSTSPSERAADLLEQVADMRGRQNSGANDG